MNKQEIKALLLTLSVILLVVILVYSLVNYTEICVKILFGFIITCGVLIVINKLYDSILEGIILDSSKSNKYIIITKNIKGSYTRVSIYSINIAKILKNDYLDKNVVAVVVESEEKILQNDYTNNKL